MKLLTVALPVAAFMLSTGTVACSSGHQPVEATTKPQTLQQVPVPDPLNVPAGNKFVASFEGLGVQIYQCADNAWTLLQPAAIISDNGKPVALHSKGPVWVSTIDGSSVAAASVPNAAVTQHDAVAELLLKATENHGVGQFGPVTYVQRLAPRAAWPQRAPALPAPRRASGTRRPTTSTLPAGEESTRR
jgi:hypothetical protein